MRFRRSLALFVLAAGLVVLAQEVTSAQDTTAKQDKKGKKARKIEVNPVVPPMPAVPVVVTPPAPLPEPPLAKKDAAQLARYIDTLVAKKLAEAKIPASPVCSDEEFVRRVYLDLTGVIPSADKAKAFIDSTVADKRAKLIDELLENPNYGRRLADLWVPRLYPRDSNNRFVLKEPLVKWLTDSFNQNMPWDKMVHQLVTASGTVEENPPVTFYLANRSVDKLTDSVSQNFLGIQLQCAQCHNHPFTEWKQTEYWGMAAFFSKVQPQNPRNANKGGDNTKIGVQELPSKSRVKDFFPESAKDVPAKFLEGDVAPLTVGQPYRPVLANWMVSPHNPFFSKAIVNRTWGQMFGTGFVNPIDDLLPENTPSHPDLLAGLARQFSADGYDLKHLYRAICNSQTYQRTSKPLAANKDDVKYFSHMTMKVMSPEQLYDSLTQVAGPAQTGERPRPMNPRPGGGSPRDQFVTFYLAGADAVNPMEYEAGIPQALRLMNSRLGGGNPAVTRQYAGPRDAPAGVIEKIYLAALSRRPTKDELDRLTAYVAKANTPTEAYADIVWVILNSSEFAMVR